MYTEKQKELMDTMKQRNFDIIDNDAEDAYDTLERIFSTFVAASDMVLKIKKCLLEDFPGILHWFNFKPPSGGFFLLFSKKYILKMNQILRRKEKS